MKIRCIEQGNNTYLTVGKEYEVVRVDRNFYTIINDSNSNFRYDKYLFVEVENNMKKSDLKVGMVVENRIGEKSVVLNSALNGLCIVRNSCHGELTDYKEDLTNSSMKNFDIVKVFEIKKFGTFLDLFKKEHLTLLWERKDNTEEIKKIKDEITKAQNTLIEAQRKLSELESGM